MSTELATKKNGQLALSSIISDQFKQQLALSLPKHLTPDRFARIALTCVRKVPKLMNCTQESVMSCLLQLSQYGLEPDGRRAHLIPYGTECTLIIDYKGLAELALRSGLVSSLHADIVRQGDVFEYSLGKVSKHVPWYLRTDKLKPDDAGKVIAAYAICENKDGTCSSAVLSYEEVEAVRKRSRAGNNGPWISDWSEMAKKTAFRRLSKWLVLSPEFRDAVKVDEEAELLHEDVAAPVKLSDLMAESAEIAGETEDASNETPEST